MLTQLVLIALASWRLSALLSYERGPFDIFVRVRRAIGFEHDAHGRPTAWPNSILANIVACVWCLGLYTTVATYFLYELEPRVVLVIAASAGLVAVERFNNGPR